MDLERDVAIGRVGQASLLEQLEHGRAETAGHDALLEGDDELLPASGLA